jgi:hypothetical protein
MPVEVMRASRTRSAASFSTRRRTEHIDGELALSRKPLSHSSLTRYLNTILEA